MPVRVNPNARTFLRSLPPQERGRLFLCWRQLQHNPPIDNVSIFNFPLPPLIFRLQHCGGFDTLYGVEKSTGVVVIFGVAQAGQGRSLRP